MALFDVVVLQSPWGLKPTHEALWVSVGINVRQELRLSTASTEQVPRVHPRWITKKKLFWQSWEQLHVFRELKRSERTKAQKAGY